MKLGRWSWAYIPVAVVLGLIWYEFWKSGAFSPANEGANETWGTATNVAPGEAARGGGVAAPAVGTGGHPGVAVGVVPPKPEAAAPKTEGTIDEAFLNNPPVISVSFSNASLETAVASLRKALGPNASIQTLNQGGYGGEQNFSIDMKNVSVWEVLKAMSKQYPVDLLPGSNYGREGMLLNTNGNGFYRYETNGPAILYPMSISYNRSVTGQDEGVNRPQARYIMTVGAAVDPRIRVIRNSQVELLEVTDDNGRTLTGGAAGGSTYYQQGANAWNTTLTFNASEPRGKRATVKCQARFTAQLSETTVTIDDATTKIGESFMLGDRGMKLTRFEVQGGIIQAQFTCDIPQPVLPINYTITDASGRSMNFQTQSGQMRGSSANGTFSPPLKLTVRTPDQTRDMALAFELKDVPLP
jgi:hypothetical protein